MPANVGRAEAAVRADVRDQTRLLPYLEELLRGLKANREALVRFTITLRSGPPSWTYVIVMMGLVQIAPSSISQ
jgi:hypothetical protein